MSLNGIKVNHAALEQAAADMNQTVKQIDERMDRLESELEPLRSSWAGNQQQSYVVAKAKWDGAINDMRQLLQETHVAVSNSNTEYAAADRRGASKFEI